jgi:hypothetical protein
MPNCVVFSEACVAWFQMSFTRDRDGYGFRREMAQRLRAVLWSRRLFIFGKFCLAGLSRDSWEIAILHCPFDRKILGFFEMSGWADCARHVAIEYFLDQTWRVEWQPDASGDVPFDRVKRRRQGFYAVVTSENKKERMMNKVW